MPTDKPKVKKDMPKVSFIITPTKIDTRWPKKMFFGCAVSKLYNINVIQTVAPKENINHIPIWVSEVKKASILITILRDSAINGSNPYLFSYIFFF